MQKEIKISGKDEFLIFGCESQHSDGLTIAISCMSDRRKGVQLPPPCEGVRYLLLVQQANSAADAGFSISKRQDVVSVDLPNLGLSNSRNAALDLARDPFVLFSDDDLKLDLPGIVALRERLRNDPMLDFVVGWRREFAPVTNPFRYTVQRLTRYNSGRICAPEFMVRHASVLRLGIRFDPEFGVGAGQPTGEDYIFITDLIKSGAIGLSLPVITGSHPHPSTGENWSDPAIMRARKAVLWRVFGWLAPAIVVVYALKHRQRFASLGSMFDFIFSRTG